MTTPTRWQMGWYNGWSPEERRATLPIQRAAIRDGRIARPVSCSVCGTTPASGTDNPVWLHDEDYARPLAAYHICRRCHRALHARFDDAETWTALVAQHGNGSHWFEALVMDEAAMRRPFHLTYPDGLPFA